MDRNEKHLIFLAEDDPDDCDFFKSALNVIDERHELVIFNDGVMLMNHLNMYNTCHRPDLIVLDLNMPRKDGKQCIIEIRNNPLFRDTPVIIFSTSSWVRDIEALYDHGADLFVIKPNSYKNLVQLVTDILAIDWSLHQKSELFLIKNVFPMAAGIIG